ncbi:MAG: NAD(P)H-quinone dehydrogenase [Acidimicrobiia bacterium]|nr:NAD(P)H-quinone dehydrogenase [Acidimicrobiia bacterium]
MRLVIVGGGPAGNRAASTAARLGAEVTLVERDVIGGGAHLWDCIPSKAMVASGDALTALRRARSLGIDVTLADSRVDLPRVSARINDIWRSLNANIDDELTSQGVRLIPGTARLLDESRVAVESQGAPEEVLEADALLLAMGSRPRVPGWAEVDGERILISRQAYDLDALPEHIVIVGSGVTGVEFVHIFNALGCEVTLVASRRHVLPGKDPEVAYALEEELVARGVTILKGARAAGVERSAATATVHIEDGRSVTGSHVLLAIGSVPNTDACGLDAAGVKVLDSGHVPVDEFCRTNVSSIYAAGDVTDKMPLSSLAAAQGRLVGYHVVGRPARPLDYGAVAQAIFTDPEIADVGVAEAEAFGQGRKIRVTKVPFGSNPKALIEGQHSGFVKIVSDPLTGEVLGGSIVGASAAELIAPIALAVRSGLRLQDLVDTFCVHPSLSESLADAAE